MPTLNEIKERMEKIKNSDFKIGKIQCYNGSYKVCKSLRNALILYNYICHIENISDEEIQKLDTELDGIMKRKLKELNPNFSEETLKNMIYSYKRNYIVYPMDILVVDDAVFQKEAIYDDFGSIYKIQTFMFEGLKPYYSISDVCFTLPDDLDFFSFKELLTIEEDQYTSKFISDNINAMYKQNITKPKYELNKNGFFYGYGGLVEGEIRGVNVYLNKKFPDIGRSLKAKEEYDIKICIQNEDDVIIYYVHQSFKDNEPIWDIVKTNTDIWKLTDEVLKLENKNANTECKLTRKKKQNLS